MGLLRIAHSSTYNTCGEADSEADIPGSLIEAMPSTILLESFCDALYVLDINQPIRIMVGMIPHVAVADTASVRRRPKNQLEHLTLTPCFATMEMMERHGQKSSSPSPEPFRPRSIVPQKEL